MPNTRTAQPQESSPMRGFFHAPESLWVGVVIAMLGGLGSFLKLSSDLSANVVRLETRIQAQQREMDRSNSVRDREMDRVRQALNKLETKIDRLLEIASKPGQGGK